MFYFCKHRTANEFGTGDWSSDVCSSDLSFAIVAAILAALFSIINVSLIKSDDHFVITFYEMIFACLFTGMSLPFYFLYVSHEVFEWPTLEQAMWLLILASVCTVFAVSYSIKLMKRLSAFFVNLTINLEPIYEIGRASCRERV